MKKIRQFVTDKRFGPIPTAVSSSSANSNCLSDDLNDSEHRIDFIKQTCEVLLKRFGSIQNNSKSNEVVAVEKRIKKVPEYVLGSNMFELGSRNGAGSCLGEILEDTGKLEMKLGAELIEYQDKIEKFILQPIQKILNDELPAYYKCKRQLVKLCEQMEGAKAKVQRQSMIEGGGGAGGGVNSGQDELDEIVGKVDQARDTLTSLHYGLLSRESELSTLTVNFLKYQHSYYSNINKILESLCPEIEILLQNEQFPVFGADLEEHLKSGGRRVAYVIEHCVCALLENLDEEGVLRMAGGSSRVRKLKSAFDAHLITLPILLQQYDTHSIATCLKSYLRSLPVPIISSNHLPTDQTPNTMRELIHSLPEANQHNLRYLIEFLSRLESRSELNKMSASNIAIVIGPNLIIENQSIDGVGGSMARGASIVDWLLRFKTEIWSGEWKETDFYVTCTRPEPSSSSPKPVQRRHKSRPAPTVPPPPVFGNRDAFIETQPPSQSQSQEIPAQSAVAPSPRPHSEYKRPPPPPQIPVQSQMQSKAHPPAKPQSSIDATESSEADEESGGSGGESGSGTSGGGGGGGRMVAEPQKQQPSTMTIAPGNDKTAIKELLADWCRDKAESRGQVLEEQQFQQSQPSAQAHHDDIEENHVVTSSRSFREPPSNCNDSSAQQEPNYYSLPRPVPAPRSSLLNNTSVNKPPVTKKPTIGAKPAAAAAPTTGLSSGGPGRPPPPPSVTMAMNMNNNTKSFGPGGIPIPNLTSAPLAKTESTDL